jgi:hypothetical protein
VSANKGPLDGKYIKFKLGIYKVQQSWNDPACFHYYFGGVI